MKIYFICNDTNRVYFLSAMGFESLRLTRANESLLRWAGFVEVDGKTFLAAIQESNCSIHF